MDKTITQQLDRNRIEIQYTILSDLVMTKTLIEIVQVLLRYVGDGADFADVIQLDYDMRGVLQGASIVYRIDPKNNSVDEPKMTFSDQLDVERLYSWSVNAPPIYFLETESERDAEPLLNVFLAEGVSSSLMMPLSKTHGVAHVIVINWHTSHVFVDDIRQLLNRIRQQLDVIYQNQQLLQQAQSTSSQLAEQVHLQRVLNDLSMFASKNSDEKLLLDKSARILLEIMKVDHVGIMLIEDDRKMAYLATELPVQVEREIRIPYDGGVWKKLERGEYQFVKDEQHLEYLPKESQDAVRAVGVKSSLFLPILDVSGYLIGSVGLDRFAGELVLSDEQIQTARLINSQLVTQLQNLRLIKELRETVDKMKKLARFSEDMQVSLDVDDILRTALSTAQRFAEFDYVSVSLWDHQKEQLVVRAYHQDGVDVTTPMDMPQPLTDDTTIGRVWQTRRFLCIEDASVETSIRPMFDGIESMFTTMIFSHDVLGVFEVGYTSGRLISPFNRNVIVQFANYLAFALESANAYAQSQRMARNEALINEIGAQLQVTNNIESTLSTAARSLKIALGARRVSIKLKRDS